MAIEREKFGELAVEAVLDFERLERQKRTELPQKMREAGRITATELQRAELEWARKYKPGDEYAKEFLKHLTAEFKAKVGVARAQLQYGLIDKRELARVSREAAREANAAILSEMGAVGKGHSGFGVLAGGIREIGEEMDQVAGKSRRGAGGVGEMRESFASLLAQLSGVHPVLGRIVNVFGGMALGSIWMAGVLGGLAAVAAGWRKITEDARKSREESQAALRSLEALSREQRFGPGSDLAKQLEESQLELDRRRAALESARDALDAARGKPTGTEGAVGFGGALPREATDRPEERVKAAQKSYDDAKRMVEDGEAELARVKRDAEVGNLAALIANNNATEQEMARAREIIDEDRAALARLAEQHDMTAEEVLRRRAQLTERIAGMERAIEATSRPDEKEADRLKKAADEALDRLEFAAARQREVGPLASRLGLTVEAIPDGVVQKLRAIVKLEGEIAGLEKDAALLGGKAPPDAIEFIEGQRRVLRQLRDEVARALPALQEASDALGELAGRAVVSDIPFAKANGSVGFVNDSMVQLKRQLIEVQEAEEELRRARLANDPERAARAEERLADARTALRASTGALAAALEKAGLPAKKVRELLKEIEGILAAAGIDAAKFGQEMSKWEQYGRMSTVLARGLLSVADATGQISEEARRAVAGLLDILDGLEQIDRAKQVEGFAQTLGFASGGMALLGGLASIFSLFGGRDSGRERAAEELRKQLAENARQVRENTEALREFSEAALSDVSGAERAAMEDAGDRIAKAIEENGATAANVGVLSQWTGLSPEEVRDFLEWVEKTTGTKFFDSEKGILDATEFLRAWSDFEKKGLGAFPEGIGGAIDGLHFQWQVLGEDILTAADRVNQFIEVVRNVPGGKAFADALAEALAEGGPEAADALIDEWARRFAAGDQSLFAEGGPFFGLTAEEVRQLLEEGNSLLEDLLRAAPGGTTQDFVQARSITEHTALRMEGALYGLEAAASQELTLSVERNDLLRMIAGERFLSGQSGRSSPSFNPTSYAPVVGGGAGGGFVWQQNGPLIEGDINVSGVEDHGIIQSVHDKVLVSVRAAVDEASAREMDRRMGRIRREKLNTQGRTR